MRHILRWGVLVALITLAVRPVVEALEASSNNKPRGARFLSPPNKK